MIIRQAEALDFVENDSSLKVTRGERGVCLPSSCLSSYSSCVCLCVSMPILSVIVRLLRELAIHPGIFLDAALRKLGTC